MLHALKLPHIDLPSDFPSVPIRGTTVGAAAREIGIPFETVIWGLIVLIVIAAIIGAIRYNKEKDQKEKEEVHPL